ncbi:MAG: metabolite traffic protein EboE [Verrucomicrobia bacterium]|nr:metabolite traffic protein EboE [Verrucomicrobiota bacterium]
MKIQSQPDLHLTYSLNVHPGETWAENLAAIREKTFEVKDRLRVQEPFGLGLRISDQASRELTPDAIAEFKQILRDNDAYVFTINGFPFGRFHGTHVKENVYSPDWRTPARRDYTLRLIDILAELLPAGQSGSISTVPCAYASWVNDTFDEEMMAAMLLDCAVHCASIHAERGIEIHLGLEPEPDCFLETTAETISFFEQRLLPLGRSYVAERRGCSADEAEVIVRRHLGVCFDTCHVALQFGDLAESFKAYVERGIRISKVQLSAALQAHTSLDALAPFREPVYFHQTRLRSADGRIRSWPDLSEALDDLKKSPEPGTVRVHYHVPLFWQGSKDIESTAQCITPEFVKLLTEGHCRHLEIETYTFDVLPAEVRTSDVVESIVREYEWTFKNLKRET